MGISTAESTRSVESTLPGLMAREVRKTDTAIRALRASLDSELERWELHAARQYEHTHRLHAFGSNDVARGSARLCPKTAARLGVTSGDTIWLMPNGTSVPLTVETQAHVAPNRIWLNRADLFRMNVIPGVALLATGVWPALSGLEPPHKPYDRHDGPVVASVP